MKKFFIGVVLSVLLIANNALAMTFQQPVEIGSIFVTPSSGIIFKNATYNTGTPERIFMNEQTYRNGTARWGNEIDGIYCHYEKYPFRFGGKDKNFPLTINVNVSIKQIKTDRNITLYLIENDGTDIRIKNYFLLGRRQDGTWMKYFDATEFMKQYFGEDRFIYLAGAHCQTDSITIAVEKMRLSNKIKIGELRFKWDDKAQWFGIEHIVY